MFYLASAVFNSILFDSLSATAPAAFNSLILFKNLTSSVLIVLKNGHYWPNVKV